MMNKDRIVNLLFGAIVIVGLGLLVARTVISGRPAPDPAIFSAHLTFHQAMAQANLERKPVLAVLSASWCSPCQAYRRGALVDPAVEKWVSDHAIAVHVDVDEDSAAAEALGVSSIPVTVLIRDNAELGRFTGAQSADGLLAWLEATSQKAAPTDSAPAPN